MGSASARVFLIGGMNGMNNGRQRIRMKSS